MESDFEMRSLLSTGLALGLIVLMTGCGQTGPLYLPDSPQQAAHKKDEFILKSSPKDTSASKTDTAASHTTPIANPALAASPTTKASD